MNDGAAILVVPVLLLLAAAGLAWHFSRSRSLLEQWAMENGYELLHTEYRNLFRGPFFWTSSKGQTVYYVKVRDRQGTTRSGWVRCGGWWLGLLSDKTQVRWED